VIEIKIINRNRDKSITGQRKRGRFIPVLVPKKALNGQMFGFQQHTPKSQSHALKSAELSRRVGYYVENPILKYSSPIHASRLGALSYG
jgi:hypothetical protein